MWNHYGFQLEKNMSSKMVFSCEHMAKARTQTACICLYCKWRILKENLAIWTTSVLMKLLCISGTVFVISVLMREKCPESECRDVHMKDLLKPNSTPPSACCSCQLWSAARTEIYSQPINFTCAPINITWLAIISELPYRTVVKMFLIEQSLH